jgi:thermitase
MRPHLIVILSHTVEAPHRPHWTQIMRDKSGSRDLPTRDLASLFSRHDVPVWTAQEYQPRSNDWSADEMAAGLNRIYRLILQRTTEIPRGLIEDIRLLPEIEGVRIGQVGQATLPRVTPVAMGTRTDSHSRNAIRLPEAHRFTKGHPDVTIAVLDTGVDTGHDEYADNLLPGKDFVDIIDGATEFLGDYLGADNDPTDEVGHGAHVTGIIVARGRNMPEGVVPRCRILPVRVLAAMRQGARRVGAGLIENINAGVVHAIHKGAEVINMSLGVRHSGGGLPHQEVIDYAARRGVTIVAAAGNDGREELYYPGAYDSVIAVGSMARDGSVSSFSTYGPQVDLIAPGEAIYSSYLGNNYAHATGTSHAAPFVAGAAAMLRSYGRERGGRLDDRQVKSALKHTCDRIDDEFKSRRAGYGRLNLRDALRFVEAQIN